MRKFLDVETDLIITEPELLKEFNMLFESGETDCINFGQYINACTDKNGSLLEVKEGV